MKKILILIFIFNNFIGISQIVNIPDPNFKEELLNHDPIIDINGDGEIQVSEAESALSINIIIEIVESIEGVEAFVNLESLVCTCISLENINIEDLTSLKTLDLSFNQLETLDVSNNILLEHLTLDSNLISSLDLSNNNNLTFLSLGFNPISEIDLTNNLTLNTFWLIGSSLISDLDLSNNTALENLNVQGNNLITEIDLSNNTELKFLNLSDNSMSEIDLSNNIELLALSFTSSSVSQIDLINNVNLITLDLFNNLIEEIDLSQNGALEIIGIQSNMISEINIGQNTDLNTLRLQQNFITSIDVSQNAQLESLELGGNLISSIDLTENTNLRRLDLSSNPISSLDLSNNPLCILSLHNNFELEYINIKNSFNNNFNPEDVVCENLLFANIFEIENAPNLQFMCVDDIAFAQEFMFVSPQTIYVEDCSIINGEVNFIQGLITYDEANDGCDSSDLITEIPLLINTYNGIHNFASTSDVQGFYTIPTGEGNFTTTLLGIPDHFSITPVSSENTFIGFDQTEIINFCIQPTSSVQDISVVLIPTNEARPGFDANYILTYENTGTTAITNTEITLTFDDSRVSFSQASSSPSSQTVNSLSWDTGTITPFSNNTIEISFDVFEPPTNASGDILTYTSTITPISNDTFPNNNIFLLDQEIVNSFDPNDIIVLQGNEVPITNADDFLHYLIRFQNTGTASAINVRIQNDIEEQLDWTTFKVLDSSHDLEIQLINQQIDFIFDNINLPDESSDLEGSQGYVLYKIKPIDDIVVGDIVNNTADIFFDFNTAITTNIATTTFVEPLSLPSTIIQYFDIYPNPAKDQLILSFTDREQQQQLDHLIIVDMQGKILKKDRIFNFSENKVIDINGLAKGVYFVQIYSDLDNKKFTRKLIIQ